MFFLPREGIRDAAQVLIDSEHLPSAKFLGLLFITGKISFYQTYIFTKFYDSDPIVDPLFYDLEVVFKTYPDLGFQMLRDAADAGDPEAMHLLGLYNSNVVGLHFLHRATLSGHIPAGIAFVKRTLQNESIPTINVIPVLENNIRLGCPESLLLLHSLVENGLIQKKT
jgi:hypothetical protein